MQTERPFVRAWALLLALAAALTATGQIPAPVTTAEPTYKTDGLAGQPFSVEVLDAHRTVGNTLLVRLAITNRGSAPLAPKFEFADGQSPEEAGKISGLHAVDPNGEAKYGILRDAENHTICSRIDPPVAPGERRDVFAQLAPPPETSPAVSIVFPMAQRILNVPIGLPGAGEPAPASASIGDPGAAPSPAVAPQPGPPAVIARPGSNMAPDVYTNQTGIIPPGSALRAVGSVQSANATVPFTVEALGLKRGADGVLSLRLSITNNGSGQLEAAGQFTNGIADPASSRKISGVYLVDPATHARYEVARASATGPACSEIAPALGPGERREVDARFSNVPGTVKSVYVYFPHAAPIPAVPATP